MFDFLPRENFDEIQFYESFTPIQRGLTLPEDLREYAKGLEAFLGLDLAFSYEERPVYISEAPLDPKKAILLLSGGVDSTYTALSNLSEFDEILAVFIRGLNPSISSREERAVQTLTTSMGVRLEILQHHKDLKTLHRKDKILTEELNVDNLLESHVKNQYAMFLCLDLIEEHQCGTFLIPADDLQENDPDISEDDVYSDTRESYSLFAPFLKKITNGIDVRLCTAKKKDKIAYMIDNNVFGDLWFCYMSQLYFKAQQNRVQPPYDNMCGACWKCKQYLKVFKKYALIKDVIV